MNPSFILGTNIFLVVIFIVEEYDPKFLTDFFFLLYPLMLHKQHVTAELDHNYELEVPKERV